MGRLWRTAPALLALTALFWAGNAVIGRAVADRMPPVAFAFWRWTAAFVLLLPVAWPYLRADLPELRRKAGIVVALSVLGVTLFNTLLYRALHETTAVNAVLVQSTMPLATMAATALLFRERPGVRQVVAILVSFLGVGIIVARGSPAGLLHTALNRGDLLVLAAAAAYSLYSALLRLRPAVHPLSLVAVTFAVGDLLLLPLYLAEHLSGAVLHPSLPALAAIGYAAVFPSVLAGLFYNRGVELLGAVRAGHFLHLSPAIGAGLAVLFLGERLYGYHLAGIALIAAGLLVANLGRTGR